MVILERGSSKSGSITVKQTCDLEVQLLVALFEILSIRLNSKCKVRNVDLEREFVVFLSGTEVIGDYEIERPLLAE